MSIELISVRPREDSDQPGHDETSEFVVGHTNEHRVNIRMKQSYH